MMSDEKRSEKHDQVDVEETLSILLAISGFISFIICGVISIVFIRKNDCFELDTRNGAMLMAVTFINLCSAYTCIDWEEGDLTKFLKYISALSIFSQMLLILLCENEWTMSFVRIMVLNIICYIPFTLSFLFRLLGINKRKSPAIELIGVVMLSCVAFLNYRINFDLLTIMAGLSLITILPNAAIQMYYYTKRRN